MNTPQHAPIAICAYAKCGKSFVKSNPKRLHCSRSCRVKKCTSKKKENTSLSGTASVLMPSSPAQATLPDFITEIKVLSKQIHDAKTRTADDITFAGVLESLIANFTAKFLERLLMGDPVNDKLDYIIKQIQHLSASNNQLQAPVKGGIAQAYQGISIPTPLPAKGIQIPYNNDMNKGMGMGMTWPDDTLF